MDFYRTKGMKYVTHAFTQNDFQEKEVKNTFKLNSYRMISGHPLPNDRISVEERFSNRTILWCGNLGIHKRPGIFIQLARSMLTSGYKFVMVGGHSNNKYVSQILEDIPGNLEITGRLSFDQSLAFFNQATLFINTSSPGGDGFPNTFIQSWLRGVPVITFGFDPDEVVSDNKLGFTANNYEEAAKSICVLLNNYMEYQRYSERAVIYAIKHHSLEIMTDNFLQNILSSV